MQVRGIGRTVVVKTIGQLDVCGPVEGGMMTEIDKMEQNTMGEIIEMINSGK